MIHFKLDRNPYNLVAFSYSIKKLGPNVSIGFGVTIGAGVRVRESIILGNSVVQNHSCILYSIIGWNSTIGPWVRIEGTPSDPGK